jgi:hypothetical protein
MNDSIEIPMQEVEGVRPDLIEKLSRFLQENPIEERAKKKSGRPQQVQWTQIMLGVLVSVLFGMSNYQQLWRRLRRKDLGDFAPIRVQDDALIKRLKNAGTEPFERLLQQMGHQQGVAGTAGELARFACEIVAIDEMTGDQMRRQLKEQRELKKGDKRLLPGKLAGRFNIRRQQWELVQWREDVQANCKVNVGSLLQGMQAGSLVLFDLGYFAFWWFDELSRQGYWWVSRVREKTSYELVHVFWRYDGNVDALIWLGAHRADRAGRMVRMVRFWDGKMLHTYITNVLDPRQLSMKEIAQLYGRRWDIELAFLLLKEYLGLHHWWSSQPVLQQQQCLVVLIVAQVLQGMRMQMAVQAGVDAFDVSLPLLVQLLPELLQERQEPLEWMRRYGRELAVIRPSSRLEPKVPEIVEGELVMPEQEKYQERKARYHCYRQGEEKGKEKRMMSKTGTQKKREGEKEEKARGGKGEGKGEKDRKRKGKGKSKEEEEQGKTAKEEKSGKGEDPQGGEEEKKKSTPVKEKKKSEEERNKGKRTQRKEKERVQRRTQESKKQEERQKGTKTLLFVREGLPEFSG